MFEQKSASVISPAAFLRRMLRFSALSAAMILSALLIGVVGYRMTEHLDWIDALLNASMILSGMGPANTMLSVEGKLFASAYALFSGIVFVSCAGLFFAPMFHRIIHSLHADLDADSDSRS